MKPERMGPRERYLDSVHFLRAVSILRARIMFIARRRPRTCSGLERHTLSPPRAVFSLVGCVIAIRLRSHRLWRSAVT
jgi:hypothetical protein